MFYIIATINKKGVESDSYVSSLLSEALGIALNIKKEHTDKVYTYICI